MQGDRERSVREFAENYMEKLFYFCLRKTGNQTEAEDLTQDIALNVLTALHRGAEPTNFSAWVWQIARNRYAAWATARHVHRATLHSSDIADLEIGDDSEDIADEVIRQEQLAILRRELAFIRSEYRSLLVAYYLENRSVRELSQALSLSADAVRQRLHRARTLLKEGMNMAREFGVRSYRPEQVAFVQNGVDGSKGQPWSIITHLLYKNIFLEAYENPMTAEELSLSLGIALPYMEDELAFLVNEQLLRREGDRYLTDFRIVSRAEQWAVHEANRQLQKPLTDRLCALIDRYMALDGARADIGYIGYEAAKWALLVHAFDLFQYTPPDRDGPGDDRTEHPSRPDGGAWTLTGYETIDWQEPAFVGLNGYLSHDSYVPKRNIGFGQYKFFYRGMQEQTPTHLTWHEAYTLWLVCTGRSEACERGYLEKLVEYGYLSKQDGTLRPQVVLFNSRAVGTEDAAAQAELHAIAEEIRTLMAQAPHMVRGYIVEQALKDGWLREDRDPLRTRGAYMYK